MKILPLSIGIFFATLGALYFSHPGQMNLPENIPQPLIAKDLPSEPPVPSYKIEAPEPQLTATGIYIRDENGGHVLYEKNAITPLAPASVTKMMTALISSEVYALDMVVTVPPFKVDGQKMGLYAGEQLSIESLLYGALVDSANDAAEVLARIYPGGRDAFVKRMNERAHEVGMSFTVFKNPSGLDQEGHVSTAYDMAMLGREVMSSPKLRQIVSTTKGSVYSYNGKTSHKLVSTNELLSTVPGVLGIKTGWTEVAHENLVTYVTRDNHTIIISLLGSNDRFGETKKLIEWVYENAHW